MSRIVNDITGIEGVTANGAPRIKMQVNRRYHGLKFFTALDGVTHAVGNIIDRVRLYVNGNTVRDVPASYLLTIAALNGLSPAAGELPIMFSEPWRADKIDEVMTAWDMFGEGSFEVELTLKAPVGVIGISGTQIFDYGRLNIDGKPVKQIVRQTVIAKNAAAGQNDFDNLPIRDPLLRVHLVSSEVISEIEVSADRNKVYDANAATNTAILRDYGLTAQAGVFTYAADFTERIDDALVVNSDLNLRFTIAGAAAVYALVESKANGFA